MSVFPILRLPFVASKDVVDQMDLGDLTALFLCSKKTQKLIKASRKSVSFVALSLEQKKSLNFLEIIELFREEKRNGIFLKDYAINYAISFLGDMAFMFDVEFDTQTDDWKSVMFNVYVKCVDQQDRYERTGTKRNLRIGDVIVPVVMTSNNIIHTFWPEKKEGFKTIGEYLKQKNAASLFSSFFICRNGQEFSADLRFVVNWLNSKNQVPSDVTILDTKINKDDMKFILDNVHPKKDLDIYAEIDDQFEYNGNFELKNLRLTHANWFTFNNLLMTDCECICFKNSKFTNNDFKEYLEQWTTGKFPKLKSLDVEMQENMNIDIILSSLKNSPEQITIIRKNDSVHLERNDAQVLKISTPGSTPTKFEVNINEI